MAQMNLLSRRMIEDMTVCYLPLAVQRSYPVRGYDVQPALRPPACPSRPEVQDHRSKYGLLPRVPSPKRRGITIPIAKIDAISTKLLAVMPGTGYHRFRSGRFRRLYALGWAKELATPSPFARWNE